MKPSGYRDWRCRQIAFTTRWLVRIGKVGAGARLIRIFRDLPGTRAVFRWATGYMRPFASLADAQQAISGQIANEGHENPLNIEFHIHADRPLRPGTYAALFHLRGLIPGTKLVFDLGGNAGNLYYVCRDYLDLPPDLVWHVNDLPAYVAAGQDLAAKRGATQLRFSRSWQDADGADVLIASGSLHYFATPLPELISQLRRPPKYVLINRTPLQDGTQVATVQDAQVFRVACVLYNRDDLIRGFEVAGYELIDVWRVPELSLFIPGYPEHSVQHYSGMLLRQKCGSPALVAAVPRASAEGMRIQ